MLINSVLFNSYKVKSVTDKLTIDITSVIVFAAGVFIERFLTHCGPVTQMRMSIHDLLRQAILRHPYTLQLYSRVALEVVL